MGHDMKGKNWMAWGMDKENFLIQMAESMMGNGKKIKCMEKVRCIIKK